MRLSFASLKKAEVPPKECTPVGEQFLPLIESGGQNGKDDVASL